MGSSDNKRGSGIKTAGGSCVLANNNVTCTVEIEDNAGNKNICRSGKVTNIDTTKPTITRTGDEVITIVKNAPYTDQGATCSDNYDTTCTVQTAGTVDTNTLGDYTITYTAKDAAGNTATPVTRTVKVVAGNAPVITRNGDEKITLEVHSTYTDEGATATDTEDGTLTDAIQTTGTVDTSRVGTYTITYTVTDSSDNTAIPVTRTIIVQDTTKPTITRRS